MATKYFCDYCNCEMPDDGRTVVFKFIAPGSDVEKRKVFPDTCESCAIALQERFEQFLAFIGDSPNDD